jgi:hypothetical protein
LSYPPALAIVWLIVHGKVGGRTSSTSGHDGEQPVSPHAVGKRTLVETSLGLESSAGQPVQRQTSVEAPLVGGRQREAAVQRTPAAFGVGTEPTITPPKGGIDKVGFIDQSDGANIRTGPAESGGKTLRDQPLPPATRVFVSGTHPDAPQWWYVTAYLKGTVVRGYVQGFRVNTDLPEPLAELHEVVGNETAEQYAKQKFGDAVSDGHDLRYYENVLLYVNQQRGRAGITGTYQDPGVLGGGSNNVQLTAGHRIWLVSAAYAKALQSVVPSGSFTGGAVAKVKRFVGHIEDILRSVTESRHHFGEVAGEYAQAIRDHLPEIAGIVAAFKQNWSRPRSCQGKKSRRFERERRNCKSNLVRRAARRQQEMC